MSQEKTTIVGLTKVGSKGQDGQGLEGLIILDEGHSRPSWSFANMGRASRSWVPEAPETMLLDGLLMLVTDYLKVPSLVAQIDNQVRNSKNLVDLNRNPISSAVRSSIRPALADYTVLVVCLEGSFIPGLVGQLGDLGVSYKVLTDSGNQ